MNQIFFKTHEKAFYSKKGKMSFMVLGERLILRFVEAFIAFDSFYF